jgi:hypothetical protein
MESSVRRVLRKLLVVVAGMLVLPVAEASATPIALSLRGTVTEATPFLASLGVSALTPLEARIVYDSETPPSPSSPTNFDAFDNPFLEADVRVGDLVFGLRSDGCCDSISIRPDQFQLGVALEERSTNLLRIEMLRIKLRAPEGDSFFEDTSALPRGFETLLPAADVFGLPPSHSLSGATTDPDAAGAFRFGIAFEIDSISATPVPEPGYALLVGLGLAALGLRTRGAALPRRSALR